MRRPHTDLHTQARSVWCVHMRAHTHKFKLLVGMLARTYACAYKDTYSQRKKLIDSTEGSLLKRCMFTDAEKSELQSLDLGEGFLWLQLVPTASRSGPAQPRGVVEST